MRVLLHVRANEHSAATTDEPGHSAQQSLRSARAEVADGRSREIDDAPGTGRQVGRKFERFREVGTDGPDSEPQIIVGQTGGSLLEMLARNIDGEIRGRAHERIENQPGFDARPAAVLDQCDIRPDPIGHRCSVLAQNSKFGPRRIILGQFADGVEEPRALGVVEVLARQPLVRPAESAQDFGAERGSGRSEVEQRSDACVIGRSQVAGRQTASGCRAERSSGRSGERANAASHKSRRAAPSGCT